MGLVTCAVVGAGERGNVYAAFSEAHPDRLRVVAVAEPRKIARQRFAARYGLDDGAAFASWVELAARPRLADIVVIAVQDRMHHEAAVALAASGYHILLEKPMAVTAIECKQIKAACDRHGVMLAVCHVLRYGLRLLPNARSTFSINPRHGTAVRTARYAPVNRKIKELIDSGAIGEVINVQHREPVGFYHFAHSFVRGNWRSEAESAPALLAKSCHDIDLIRSWLAPAVCTGVSSFGSLVHFRRERRPDTAGGAVRCLDCPIARECPYSACRVYLDAAKEGRTGWPVSVVSETRDIESLTEALRTGPYGRCVYECDNDVVDSQVVAMEFDGGQTASFSMVACTEKLCVRQTTVSGSLGELSCDDGRWLRHFDFGTGEAINIDTAASAAKGLAGHGGADYHLMDAFVRAVAENNPSFNLSPADEALASHLLVFAAEKARLTRSVVVPELA